MKLRAIKIDKRFIPEFNGNKELPLNEQVIIHFTRIPGTSEKHIFKNFKFETGGAIQLAFNDNLLASMLISKIENLEIGGEKIKDGSALANSNCPALTELFTEIRDYVFPDAEELDEGES